MNAQEIIDYISNSEKKTPVKVYINTTAPVNFGTAKVFGAGNSFLVFGDWAELAPILEKNRERISEYVVENDRRNSGVPLLDLKNIKARIEPGALIREKVEIGDGAVIMMGAVINIGAIVGAGTMSLLLLISFFNLSFLKGCGLENGYHQQGKRFPWLRI